MNMKETFDELNAYNIDDFFWQTRSVLRMDKDSANGEVYSRIAGLLIKENVLDSQTAEFVCSIQ